ncbi:MAG: chemotaxis protein CheB, partial [Hyphomicrobiaceae bacterium]
MNTAEMPRPHSSYVPVCAIGASAGGVTALQQFFSNVGDDLGAAFVVVVHLAPDHPSQLDKILAARTSMPVHQVSDAPQLKPNCVYVIPPDRELVINGNDISARPFSEPRGRRAPIDMFFRSVAQARGDGIAMVLSGSGSDGALGVRAVKEAGGVILVQEPDEAEYASMPRAAIATGFVDDIAPVADLARRVGEVLRNKKRLAELSEHHSELDVIRIVTHLHRHTGHDFSSYKRPTLVRRISRRMQITGRDDLAAYLQYLEEQPDEVRVLLSDLLISVTRFFRDPQAFATLETDVVRPLFDRIGAGDGIRVWVVGCATGEEAYSIGMLLLEEAERRGARPAIQIFASDIDEGALATAREGRYVKAIEADVSEERLRKFFVADGASYRVRKDLRELVLFTSHSALKDPPFIKLDLVACRNLLIYMQRPLQNQLIDLFHYALKPRSYLFLGSAETIDAVPRQFRPVDRDARIFVSQPTADKTAPPLPQLVADHRHLPLAPLGATQHVTPAGAGYVHASALEQHAPPSALIDETGSILHLSPSASRFLLAAEGPFTPYLVAQARPELRIDLKLALQRAIDHGEATLTLPIPVAFNGKKKLVSMNIVPRRRTDGGTPAEVLVLFLEAGEAREEDERSEGEDANHDEIRRLRQELANAQDRLAASRSEHEAATQDLRTANEELQSINEEYRSTAEELETSKEELQSINEELQTVNSELKSKLVTISAAHDDLGNLMAATDIGTLFLDRDLRIKLFTPNVARLFSITDNDVGRNISDFTSQLLYDGVESDARKVLDDLTPVESEIRSKSGRWFTMRVRPYRTREDRIDGVVVTFTDDTDRRRVADEVQAAREFAESIVDTVRDPLLVLNPDLTVRAANQRFYDQFAVDPAQTVGHAIYELGDGQWDMPELRRLLDDVLPHDKRFRDFEVTHRFDGLGERTMLLNGRQLDHVQLVLLAIEDITQRKQSEIERDLLTRELSHRVKNTLAVVQSLATQTDGDTVDGYRETFTGRLQALAESHALLLETDWREADLKHVVQRSMRPYTLGPDGRVESRATPCSSTLSKPWAWRCSCMNCPPMPSSTARCQTK